MIIRMYSGIIMLRRQARDHLVCIHVGAGARAGLKDIYWKMLIIVACGNLLRGLYDGCSHGIVHQTQSAIGPRASCLDESERANKRAWHAQPANRKVVDRALCLRAIQGPGRYFKLTHTV